MKTDGHSEIDAATFLRTLSTGQQEAFVNAVNRCRYLIDEYVQKNGSDSIRDPHACMFCHEENATGLGIVGNPMIVRKMKLRGLAYFSNLKSFGALNGEGVSRREAMVDVATEMTLRLWMGTIDPPKDGEK